MTRAIIFRIIGVAFLAFAALSIYQGEFQLGRSGGVIISRAHDPEMFWRYVIIQIGVGCALLYLSRLTPKGPSSWLAPSRPGGGGETLTSPQAVEELPKLPNYDPVFCGKVVKAAAYVCVAVIIAELLVLLLVHPSDARCPGWILHPHQRSAASLWLLAGMFTLLPGLWMCNVARHWEDSYARKMYDGILSGSPGQLLIDANWLMLTVIAFWCLFCAIPLFLMLGQCTALHQYVDAFHL
jgi:hypothetical protein